MCAEASDGTLETWGVCAMASDVVKKASDASKKAGDVSKKPSD